MKLIKTDITQTLKVIILALILTVGINYAFAQWVWTAPTATPPNGNTAAPLNVTVDGQIKSGGLTLGAGGGVLDGLIIKNGNLQIQNGNLLLSPGTNWVGIGIQPTRALDVKGDVRLRGQICDSRTIPLSGEGCEGTTDQVLTRGTSGVIWADVPGGSGITGGIQNRVAKFSSATAIGNSGITELPPNSNSSGKVGIGISDPRVNLHVDNVDSNGFSTVRISSKVDKNAAIQLYNREFSSPWNNTGWALLKTNNGGDFLINRDIAENSGAWTALRIKSGSISGTDPGWGQVTVADNLPSNYPLVKFIVNGKVVIRGGNPGAGKVLTSVNSGTLQNPLYEGLAEWIAGSPSDQALKKNIQSLGSDMLDRILKLKGVSFNWKNSSDSETRIGFVAQEVEKVFPEVVYTGSDGLKSVDYQKLVAPLVEAVKSQQVQINELKAEIQVLKNK